MRIFTIKTIGIDLYDMPLNAVNSDGDILGKTNLSFILQDTKTIAAYDETLEEVIESKKYWGDFELTANLLKYAVKSLGSKLMKPKVLISVPHDAAAGRFGELYKRMILEAGIQAGGKEVHMIENIYCAALGAGLPITEHKKTIIVYSNNWCTYLYITYAGAIIVSEILEVSYEDVKAEQIASLLEHMKKNIPESISNKFRILNLDAITMKSLETNWAKPVENKIHMIVPDALKMKYGQWLGEYQLMYANNYDHCVMEGLKYSIGNLNYIKKTQKNNKGIV